MGEEKKEVDDKISRSTIPRTPLKKATTGMAMAEEKDNASADCSANRAELTAHNNVIRVEEVEDSEECDKENAFLSTTKIIIPSRLCEEG